MIWIFLALFLVLSYYFIIKSNSKILKKCFSLLSGVFFILTISPLLSEEIFDFLLKISLLLPFMFGVLGIIFGWAGIKGEVRISLLFINTLAFIFYLFVFLIGIFGFKQP